MPTADAIAAPRPAAGWRPRLSSGWIGGMLLLLIAGPCFLTLPWSISRYQVDTARLTEAYQTQPPTITDPFGTDDDGRSLLWRCLLGGAVSLGIGAAAAGLAVSIGVTWGLVAGYAGGRVDAAMMRIVDILYGLPYILLVVLLSIAFDPAVQAGAGALGGALPGWLGGAWLMDRSESIANVVTLLVAIGAVSWLTMARVIRGQVLSLREQPFIEAAQAAGVSPVRIMRVHLLPNLIGPILVYTTLTVPQAILQESFLSFLGIGVQPPLPSWGNLATVGVQELPSLATGGGMDWWLLVFPCLLLGLTLLALNFLGDGLRERFDPRSRKRQA